MQNLPNDLREPMDMPDPLFPIKLFETEITEHGYTLFFHHWHKEIELLYITSGKATFECNSSSFEAHPGDIVVFNSNDIHYGVSMSGNLTYLALISDLALLHGHTADVSETKYIAPILQNKIYFRNHIGKDSGISDCMAMMASELRERAFGFELAVKSYLYRIFTHLLRHHMSSIQNESEHYAKVMCLQQFEPIFHYIEQHYMEQITVDELAALAGLSRSHFSRRFKWLTAKTITEYINQIRVNKAEYLLRNTPLTVSEIALTTGFSDIYYFSRMFKKLKKVTPSQIRSHSQG